MFAPNSLICVGM